MICFEYDPQPPKEAKTYSPKKIREFEIILRLKPPSGVGGGETEFCLTAMLRGLGVKKIF